MTNYERIKAMSVEEMAEAIWCVVDCSACPANGKFNCPCYETCTEIIGIWLERESDT
jgi:hypothetical protein